MSAWLDEIGGLLKDSLGERESKVPIYRLAEKMDGAPAVPEDIRRAFGAWVRTCGYLRGAPGLTDGLPWTVLKEDDEIEMLIRDRHRFTKGANIRELVEAEKKDQTARWEARVNRCKVALIGGWPEDEALCFICALDEWQTALRRAGRKAA